jgi:hypothetical protein
MELWSIFSDYVFVIRMQKKYNTRRIYMELLFEVKLLQYM